MWCCAFVCADVIKLKLRLESALFPFAHQRQQLDQMRVCMSSVNLKAWSHVHAHRLILKLGCLCVGD